MPCPNLRCPALHCAALPCPALPPAVPRPVSGAIHVHLVPLNHPCAGISLSAFYPCLRHWLDRVKARPAVQRGLNVPDPNMVLGHTGGSVAVR